MGSRRPTRRQVWLLAGVAVVTLLGMFAIIGYGSRDAGPDTASAASAPTTQDTPRSDLPTMPLAQLPPEALDVLDLIAHGGPYPFRQDNTVFSNIERLLPAREAGYYREFTVITPGENDRGRRRLVLGQAGDLYYTSDHYESFRQVLR